jgi:hypothetical protein
MSINVCYLCAVEYIEHESTARDKEHYCCESCQLEDEFEGECG